VENSHVDALRDARTGANLSGFVWFLSGAFFGSAVTLGYGLLSLALMAVAVAVGIYARNLSSGAIRKINSVIGNFGWDYGGR
jgi:hypothetical protein